MANPNVYFVDINGQTTKNGMTIAPDGSVQFVTHDSNGNQVVASAGGNIATNPIWQAPGGREIWSEMSLLPMKPVEMACLGRNRLLLFGIDL